jgi:hypothetical protein
VNRNTSNQILRALAFFIAIVLLAPYLGCHILTTPPDKPELTETTGEAENSDKLSEIDDLLAK